MRYPYKKERVHRLSTMSLAPLAAMLFVSSPRTPSLVESTAGQWEIESGVFTDGTVLPDAGASGEAYLSLGQECAVWLEIETTEGEEQHDLVVAYRSQLTDRYLDVFIDNDFVTTQHFPQTQADRWRTISIDTPSWFSGYHLIRMQATSSSGGLQLDSAETAQSSTGDDCTGCDVAPMAPPVVNFNGVAMIVPPVPGGKVANLFAAVLGGINMQTASIVKISSIPKDGECSLQPKDEDEENGLEECKEKTACKLDTAIDFRPNNYARPPFWDSTETVKRPDGTSKDFARTGNIETIKGAYIGACGKGGNAVFSFENGTVTRALSCNVCEEAAQ